jgi:hypothetical protein
MHFKTTRALSFPRPAAGNQIALFATSDALGNQALAAKRDAVDQRVACRDLESSRMDSTLRRHTLLVAAILAPLRRFDT